MEAYFKSIEGSEKWCEIKAINKGWSEDRKYYAKDDGGKEYLVRVFPYQNDYEKREEAFRDLQLFNRLSTIFQKSCPSEGLMKMSCLVFFLGSGDTTWKKKLESLLKKSNTASA